MRVHEMPPRMGSLGERVMTGYRSEFFRHNCEADGCYYQQLPKWDDLIGLFPRGIRPTDVDGMVEINGNVLFMEEKRKGVAPPLGQLRSLRALSQKDRTTVVLFRPGESSELEVLILRDGKGTGWQPSTREHFGFWLNGWANRADIDQ